MEYIRLFISDNSFVRRFDFMGNCNDGRVGGARHHRRCCNWDDFLFGNRRRRHDNVLGAEDNGRGCRGRRNNDVRGAEDDNCRRRRRRRCCNLFW